MIGLRVFSEVVNKQDGLPPEDCDFVEGDAHCRSPSNSPSASLSLLVGKPLFVHRRNGRANVPQSQQG